MYWYDGAEWSKVPVMLVLGCLLPIKRDVGVSGGLLQPPLALLSTCYNSAD